MAEQEEQAVHVLQAVDMAGLEEVQAGNGVTRAHPAPEADIQAGLDVIQME